MKIKIKMTFMSMRCLTVNLYQSKFTISVNLYICRFIIRIKQPDGVPCGFWNLIYDRIILSNYLI